MEFKLKFRPKEIRSLAGRDLSSLNENEKKREREIEEVIGPTVQERGYYTKDQLLILAHWKSHWIVHHCKKIPKIMFGKSPESHFRPARKESGLNLYIFSMVSDCRWRRFSCTLVSKTSIRYWISARYGLSGSKIQSTTSICGGPIRSFAGNFPRNTRSQCEPSTAPCGGILGKTKNRISWTYLIY